MRNGSPISKVEKVAKSSPMYSTSSEVLNPSMNFIFSRTVPSYSFFLNGGSTEDSLRVT